jgi:predicted metal-binding membrane protein
VLLAAAGLAWAGVIVQAMPMDLGRGGAASLPDATLFLAAWGVMMAAMMLPSALPMIALYHAVSRNRSPTGPPILPTFLFAATYLVVWLAVGLPVYATSGLVGTLARTNPVVAQGLPYALAVVLVAAGLYQFTALKRRCLRHCQTPLSFLLGHWRHGAAASLRMGLAHAAYCVGCCWGLMAVLVAAGAMSLPWVLGIAAVVFVEKVLPRGQWTARPVGGALLGLGLLVGIDPQLALTLRGQTTPM